MPDASTEKKDGSNETVAKFYTRHNFTEKTKVKVNRYNSRLNRFRRWLAGDHRKKFTEQIWENNNVHSALWTVSIRRFNPVTQILGPVEYIAKDEPNIRTNAGVTFFAQQCYQTSGLGTNGTNYLALSADTGAPASGDTTIVSEINNTNGMGRAQGTVVVGTASGSSVLVTISHTWTASGTVASIQKGGLFDLSVINTGNLGHEFTFTPTTVNNGDQLTIQVSITVS